MKSKDMELKELWKEHNIELKDFNLYGERFMKNSMLGIALVLSTFILVASIASSIMHKEGTYIILGVGISSCLTMFFKWVGSIFAKVLDYNFESYLVVFETNPKRSLSGIKRVSRFKRKHQNKRWYN